MKIASLAVANFRAISGIELTDLGDMVVIAGPNGCGKSCILDAIRLFKSAYGGYQPNEWHHWMNEFQINTRNLKRMVSLLRDRSRSSMIQAAIVLADDERAFIQDNLRSMLEELAWKTVLPSSRAWSRSANALATEFRAYEPQVRKQVDDLQAAVEEQLNHRYLTGRLRIDPDGTVMTTNNVLLELLFSSFHPRRIGVIDYHGAHRNYAREELGGINLNLDQEEERLRTTSLYNVGNKYSNIKSEMAAEYVKQNLREQFSDANAPADARLLTDTLHELFATFFPGKTFLGPQPTADGNLEFPVRLSDGSTHDINDLSSGEKEILFGYLRLRSSAPKYSIILLDEPELHLNPALIRGLPQFYHTNIGRDLENQVWLVTHSDTFLREAITQRDLQVFHMQHATGEDRGGNQMRGLEPGEEVESIILELVGNLATYRPGAKVVFFEGEDSEFDLQMVSRLFPTIENEVNLVSGGNRVRVASLQRTLEESVKAGNIPIKIYSVVDKDTGPQLSRTSDGGGHFSWDVYHIENYLLEATYLDEALGRLNVKHRELSSLGRIERRLKRIAKEQINRLILHKLNMRVNRTLLRDLKLRTNPTAADIGTNLHECIVGALRKMEGRLNSDLSVGAIREEMDVERRRLTAALKTEDWKKHFRGRDVLRVFAGTYVRGMRYEYFRDLIISQMSAAGYKPAGMRRVLDQIVAD